ncbi:alpha/beta hydrolase [Arcanobacterium ihumii]|uniref:alpha/beta hydrolase n=1 Tax=Arcanobacterium ihumii TaxID=2138162 RepID=UPI001F45F691|nr:alpha/beta hydrolase [Arcanobacterium ihumii]
MKKIRYAAVILAIGLSLSACNSADQKSSQGDGAKASVEAIDAKMPEVPAGLEDFYNQKVSWEKCGTGLECTTFKVPLDYANPKAKTITIAAKKRRADEKAIGSLFVNPGGPGGGGQEMAESAAQYLSDDVLKNFDVIGFDPRGVGESTPVDCLDDAELGKGLEASFPKTAEGQDQYKQQMQQVAASCGQKSGDLLKFVGTESAARDIDVMRQVLGDPKLYYVGYSYGTSLGGMYADLFPKNVGRVVLDGAVSSNATNFDQAMAQVKGFDDAFTSYVQKCLKGDDCPFKGSVDDARKKVADLFESTLKEPIPTKNVERPLTQAALMLGIITPLYDDSSWQLLSQAFSQVFEKNDGSMFQLFFDAYTGRQGNKFTNNSIEANWAINCADQPASGTETDWDAGAKKIAEVAPVFGPTFGYDEYLCSAWPFQPKEKHKAYEAKGSDPIVVVGTKGDPATPYQWAVDFSKALDNSVLVTYEGEGHTAYGRSTTCVSEPIDRYLLNGTTPKEGLSCAAK